MLILELFYEDGTIKTTTWATMSGVREWITHEKSNGAKGYRVTELD